MIFIYILPPLNLQPTYRCFQNLKNFPKNNFIIAKYFALRYQREEAFTTLNVDIRNHTNLFESLEQYVKGDLLEGENAYHCEKCNKKVGFLYQISCPRLNLLKKINLSWYTDWNFSFTTLLNVPPWNRICFKISTKIGFDNRYHRNMLVYFKIKTEKLYLCFPLFILIGFSCHWHALIF